MLTHTHKKRHKISQGSFHCFLLAVLLDRSPAFVFILHSNTKIAPLHLLPLVQNVFYKRSLCQTVGTVCWGTAVQKTWNQKSGNETYTRTARKPKVCAYQTPKCSATGVVLMYILSLSRAYLDTRDYSMCTEVEKVLPIQYKTMQGTSS